MRSVISVVFLAASAMVAFPFARGSSQAPARMPDIYFTPTDQPVADAMLTLARVTRDDVVYDLGSGDGRIPILAAQKFGARSRHRARAPARRLVATGG
jgi:hypothetical protein